MKGCVYCEALQLTPQQLDGADILPSHRVRIKEHSAINCPFCDVSKLLTDRWLILPRVGVLGQDDLQEVANLSEKRY